MALKTTSACPPPAGGLRLGFSEPSNLGRLMWCSKNYETLPLYGHDHYLGAIIKRAIKMLGRRQQKLHTAVLCCVCLSERFKVHKLIAVIKLKLKHSLAVPTIVYRSFQSSLRLAKWDSRKNPSCTLSRRFDEFPNFFGRFGHPFRVITLERNRTEGSGAKIDSQEHTNSKFGVQKLTTEKEKLMPHGGEKITDLHSKSFLV